MTVAASLGYRVGHAETGDAGQNPSNTAVTDSSLKLGMAAYFDAEKNSADWTQVESGGTKVSFVVVNPSSGPGPSKKAAWDDQLARLRAANIAIYGCVKSRQARVGSRARPAADYVTDIDHWYLWYGQHLTGLFIDEEYPHCVSKLGPNGETNFNEAQYYRNIVAYMKQSRNAYAPSGGVKVILNPGTRTEECMFRVNNTDDPTEDIIQVNFEATYSRYVTWTIAPGSWELNQPRDKFWHLIHTAKKAQMQDAVARARTTAKHVGAIYVTDGKSDKNFVGCTLNGKKYGTWNLLPGGCSGDTSYWPLLKQLTD